MDRREPEKRFDLSVSLHRHTRQAQTIYAPDLAELREKEKKIQKDLDDGIDYSAGEVPVLDLLAKYVALKQGVRYNTQIMYELVTKLVKETDVAYMQIKDVKLSTARNERSVSITNCGRKRTANISSARRRATAAFGSFQ
jgi:hypothetical protein